MGRAAGISLVITVNCHPFLEEAESSFSLYFSGRAHVLLVKGVGLPERGEGRGGTGRERERGLKGTVVSAHVKV